MATQYSIKKMRVENTRGVGGLLEFWMPGEIEEYILAVEDQIITLNADINLSKNCLNVTFMDAWLRFKERFENFKSDAGWWSRTSVSTLRTAERFAAELRGFHSSYEQQCGVLATMPGPNIPHEQHNKEWEQLGKNLTWIAGGALGIYTVFKIIQLRG